MSVINKMHQDFRQAQQGTPVLGKAPGASKSKKPLIIVFIMILLGSSLGLAYLIFLQQRDQDISQNIDVTVAAPAAIVLAQPQQPSLPSLQTVTAPAQQPLVNQVASQQLAQLEQVRASKSAAQQIINQPLGAVAEVVSAQPSSKPVIAERETARSGAQENTKPQTAGAVINAPESDISTAAKSQDSGALEIKPLQLSNAQLAQVKLKQAQADEEKGALALAAEKRQQALSLDPSLNDVRKTLALYYYGQGNTNKARALLQTGAVVSPEYSDFNLMLSRIAVKEGDLDKAYLYLAQNPPAVAGNLDYYVSYAILAQKFHKYQQSEQLYASLLAERPNNGRWRMALAIAQDKQNKVALALSNYKNALLQPDLSAKAKAYVEQRIIYLEKNL